MIPRRVVSARILEGALPPLGAGRRGIVAESGLLCQKSVGLAIHSRSLCFLPKTFTWGNVRSDRKMRRYFPFEAYFDCQPGVFLAARALLGDRRLEKGTVS